MKDRIRKALVLLTGVVGMLTATAAVSFTELTDQFVLSETEAALSTQYRASTSLTIKLSGTATDGVFTLMPSFYIPEGVTLTVDASGVTGGLTTIRLKGGLRGTGTVAFGAGITKLVFGAAPTLTNILGDKNKMVALEADVSFAEANGALEITGGVSLVRWPTCSYTIAEGTIVATMGSDLFTDDTLTLDQGWDLMLNDPAAITKGCKITVPTGRTLYFRGSGLYAVNASSAGHVQQWTGPTASNRFEVDIDLQGGSFQCQAKPSDTALAGTIVGDITGNGDIVFVNAASLAFEGCLNYSGTLNLKGLTGVKTCYLEAKSGSSLAGVDISIPAGTIAFAPQTTETLVVKSLQTSGSSTASVGEAGTIQVNSVIGSFAFVSAGSGAKVIVGATSDVASLASGLTLAFASADAPVRLLATGESGNFWGFENTSSTQALLDLSCETLGEDTEIALGGKIELVNPISVATLRIASDAEVKAVVGAGTKVVNGGGTLELIKSWKAKAALWTDASLASSVIKARAGAVSDYGWEPDDARISKFSENQVMDWRDCRPGRQDYRIRATKCDPTGNDLTTDSKSANYYKVFPTAQEQDGKPSLYFTPTETRARMRIATGIAKETTINVKCAVMVFNGALGGGNAILCNTSGYMNRVKGLSSTYPTVEAPLVYANTANLEFRKNGAAVDCEKTGLETGWQVLSFTCADGIPIAALGPASNPDTGSYNGGQIYGEVLLFTELPDADEILDMEKYLADKWAVEIAHGGPTSETVYPITGSGTVKLAGNGVFDATGYFSGTVDLNGNRMAIGDIKVPYKAAQIPAKDRLIWIDARAEGAVVFGDDAEKPDEIKMIYARDNNGLKTADGDYYVTSPWMAGEENTNNNRRVRYAGGWLDFKNGYTYNDTRGNALFMRKLPFEQMKQFDSAAEEINVAAGFFALDSSSKGGGSLMLSAANGGDKLLRARGSRADSAIWSLESGSTVTIDTRLNGAAVEMSDPFSGGKDVMSFNVNDGVTALVKTFGYCYPGQKSYSNNELIGEWLLYEANVPAADRERIEAYLTFKWKNELMAGFGETRDMSVSGTGTIAVANPESLPTLAQGFTGVIELTENAYAFTLPKEGAEAVEAVKLPGQTVRMQGEVTIDLDATAAKSGSYLLMSAGDFAVGTTFTLGTVTDRKTREIVLEVRDNALYADVKPNGILLIVR